MTTVAPARALPPAFTDEGDMIRACRRTLRRIVCGFTRRDRRLDYDDLYQVACVAFVRALRTYDPHKINPHTGVRYSFTAYAGRAAYNLIQDHVRKHHEAGFARFPGALDPYRDAPRMNPLNGSDVLHQGEQDGQAGSEHSNQDSDRALAVYDDGVDLNELEGVWRVAEEVLEHREYWVLWSVYAQERTDAQIARWLGLSKMRVGQIRRTALDKLRPHLTRFA